MTAAADRVPRGLAAHRAAAVMVLAVLSACGSGTPSAPGATPRGAPSPLTATAPPDVPPDAASGPPAAELSLDGARAVPGALGTYAYDGSGSDAPWLPARTLPRLSAGAGALAEVRLVDGSGLTGWRVRASPASDDDGGSAETIGSAEAPAAPVPAATFEAPQSGDWVIAVELTFAEDRGSAVYFWRLTVR